MRQIFLPLFVFSKITLAKAICGIIQKVIELFSTNFYAFAGIPPPRSPLLCVFMPLRVFLLLARRCCVFFHQQHLRQHLMLRAITPTKLLIYFNQKRSLICFQRPFLMIWKLITPLLSVLPQM